MERESFENREIAQLLNREYICVKVDREERPDIDSVYMSVCQAMNGQGGWPLTIIMTPDGRPFFSEITKNRVLQEVYRNLIEIFRPYILNSYEQQSYENHFSVLLHHELFIQAIREKDHHLGYIAVKYSMNDWSRLQGVMEESANI